MKSRPSRKPRSEDKPPLDKPRKGQNSISNESAETADSGRDLAHGEGGTIDLPTGPGDLSRDD
jgi:hypothetical protein